MDYGNFQKTKLSSVLLTGMLIVFVALIHTGLAQSTDDLLKKAEGELRRSNSKLMSGRYEDVFKQLQETDKTIAEAQKGDPDPARLKKIIDTFIKQKEKVEEKLDKKLSISFNIVQEETGTNQPASSAPQAPKQKTISGASTAAAGTALSAKAAPGVKSASPSTKTASSKSAQKLPYDARKPMQQFTASYSSFENYYKDFSSAAADMKATIFKRLGEKIDAMKTNLANAREEAAKKNVSTHPDFDEAQTKIDQSEKKYASLSGEYQKQVAAAAELSLTQASDAEGIKKLYSDLRDKIFDRATGYAIYYNNPAEVRDLLEQINAFEKNDKPKVEKALTDFTAKYGSTDADIRKNTGDSQAASSYAAIVTGLEDVQKTRGAMTESLLQKYEEEFGRLSSVHDFFKVKVVTDLKQYIAMALRFSPDNAAAKKAQADYKPRVDKALKEFNAGVDKRKWPGNSSNAPSNADKLADIALDWFKNDIGWGKRDKNPAAEDKEVRRPLAVCVKGPWSVQKTNLLGQPIMYGLPVFVAVQVDSEKDLNLVRVYDVTMRTAEKAGVKQEPPFVTLTVGNSFYIRPGAL